MKLIKQVATIIAFIICSNNMHASGNDSTTKQKGIAIFKGDTLTGDIKLNLDHDRIMVSENKINQIITARQLTRVIVDNNSFVGGKVGEDYYLFEEIVKLKASLVYKEGVKNHNLDEENIGPWFVYENGKIKPVEKLKTLMSIFESDAKWMKQHMKANALNPELKEDMIKAFRYYQSTSIH